MKNYIILPAIALVMVVGGCRKKKEEPRIPYESLSATTNYFNTFRGPDSATSVEFSAQTTRARMLREIEEYMLTFGTSPLDKNRIVKMLHNTDAPFEDTALDRAAGISIFEALAVSFPPTDANTERDKFGTWADSACVASVRAWYPAERGKPGTVGGSYLVSSNGVEYTQLVVIGVIGAMMLDQVCNVWLGAQNMAAGNTEVVAGKNYTQLEHNWDAAYGSLTVNEYYPKQNSMGTWQESYLGGYVRQVNGVHGDPSAIYLAFLKGRAAIVNDDAGQRNDQVATIRRSLEKSVATVAISYLNKARNATGEGPRFHYLSQAAGFIYALRYAYDAKSPRGKSDELMEKLMGGQYGFWDLSDATITEVRDDLSAAYVVDRDAIVNQ